MTEIQTQIEQIRKALDEADAVFVGAGAGLSTAAGFKYSGARMEKYFPDFIDKYDFQDMYSAGFYPFRSSSEFWSYWSRYIYVNRYMDPPGSTYSDLFEIVKDKDYFVITTNVDHCFQKAGFDKARLFYTQGDYGLFQCSFPCHADTYDNEEKIRELLAAQGIVTQKDGDIEIPWSGGAPTDGQSLDPMDRITIEIMPRCPRCGRPMTMNLRSDDRFVEDEGWNKAADRYVEFINKHRTGKVVYLELGVGYNTPVIIKYPFHRRIKENPDATYVNVNMGQADAPSAILDRSILIDGDINTVLQGLLT